MVWITSTVYSAPRFIYVQTVVNHFNKGGSETICILPRTKYNSQLFDTINFVLLYLVPLCVMTVLYTLIAVRLWNSSFSYPPLQVKIPSSGLDGVNLHSFHSSSLLIPEVQNE